MSCAACAPRLHKRLEELPGMHSVLVNYAAARCKIEYDESQLGIDEINQAVVRAGFSLPIESAILSCEEYDPDAAEKALKKVFGVKSVDFNTGNGQICVNLWPVGVESGDLLKALRSCGIYASLDSRSGDEEETQLHDRMSLLKTLCISVLLTMPLVWDLHPYVQLVLASLAQFGPGRYLYRSAWRSLRVHSVSMDVLVAASTTIIYLYSVYVTFTVTIDIQLYFLSECVLLSFILFGKYLETISRNEAGNAIRRLVRLRPKTALVVRGAEEKETDISEITQHDIIRVRPGERISVDGSVIEGSCTVDESMLTGESVPVEKTIGDMLYSGTLNRSGSVLMSVSGIGKDSVLEHIIDVVERAQCSKSPIERLADKIAGIFIPAVAIISLGVFALWYFCLDPGNMSKAIYCLCSMLVIVCPCALGLATPTAIMVASGRAAELGVLFRDGEQLERACKIDTIVFDKTGTLTYGEPEVTECISISGELNEALLYAASVERLSEHPVGNAVVRNAGNICAGALPFAVENFESLPGAGVRGTVQGHEVICGSRTLMQDHNIDISALNMSRDVRSLACTEILIAIDGALRAVLGVADRIRPEAVKTVSDLKSMNISVWMMTGDNEFTARAIAAKAGIDADKIISGVLPDGKADALRKLQDSGAYVCMVGDGINDAPALATADVSMSVGTGTDVAIESGGIVLLGSDLAASVRALRLAKRTMHIIHQNLLWALMYNVICIPVAATGIINPSIAAAAMSLSSNGVLFNSLRLKKAENSHEN